MVQVQKQERSRLNLWARLGAAFWQRSRVMQQLTGLIALLLVLSLATMGMAQVANTDNVLMLA
ncbi:hypothetical protein [Spirulina major]|uniref:hypothetical protein n=1 Tax=Spirulina major TaxID=270636 RepID=UPI00093530E6|nr:hypothetical protein [Spirulina major]